MRRHPWIIAGLAGLATLIYGLARNSPPSVGHAPEPAPLASPADAAPPVLEAGGSGPAPSSPQAEPPTQVVLTVVTTAGTPVPGADVSLRELGVLEGFDASLGRTNAAGRISIPHAVHGRFCLVVAEHAAHAPARHELWMAGSPRVVLETGCAVFLRLDWDGLVGQTVKFNHNGNAVSAVITSGETELGLFPGGDTPSTWR